MNCNDARQRIQDLYDGELPERIAAEVKSHIDSCPSCAREAAIAREVNAALSPMPLMKAPAHATQNVLAAVHAIAAEKAAPKSRLQFGGILTWVSAAAAAVIFVLGTLGYLPSHQSRLDTVAQSAAQRAEAAIVTPAVETVKSSPYAAQVPSMASLRLMMSEVAPWLGICVAIVIAVLVLAAVEEELSSRRLAARVSALVR